MSKHPYTAPPLIPAGSIAQEDFKAFKDVVLSKLKSFPKGTSCGRDGFRAPHMIETLSGSAAAISDELLSSISEFVNILLVGNFLALGEFIAFAPLTPLLKPGGGIRPIVISTLWRRLVSRFAASHFGKVMETYLNYY